MGVRPDGLALGSEPETVHAGRPPASQPNPTSKIKITIASNPNRIPSSRLIIARQPLRPALTNGEEIHHRVGSLGRIGVRLDGLALGSEPETVHAGRPPATSVADAESVRTVLFVKSSDVGLGNTEHPDPTYRRVCVDEQHHSKRPPNGSSVTECISPNGKEVLLTRATTQHPSRRESASRALNQAPEKQAAVVVGRRRRSSRTLYQLTSNGRATVLRSHVRCAFGSCPSASYKSFSCR